MVGQRLQRPAVLIPSEASEASRAGKRSRLKMGALLMTPASLTLYSRLKCVTLILRPEAENVEKANHHAFAVNRITLALLITLMLTACSGAATSRPTRS